VLSGTASKGSSNESRKEVGADIEAFTLVFNKVSRNVIIVHVEKKYGRKEIKVQNR
jgi:hypothetical protein